MWRLCFAKHKIAISLHQRGKLMWWISRRNVAQFQRTDWHSWTHRTANVTAATDTAIRNRSVANLWCRWRCCCRPDTVCRNIWMIKANVRMIRRQRSDRRHRCRMADLRYMRQRCMIVIVMVVIDVIIAVHMIENAAVDVIVKLQRRRYCTDRCMQR